jgi:hypothetical protein
MFKESFYENFTDLYFGEIVKISPRMQVYFAPKILAYFPPCTVLAPDKYTRHHSRFSQCQSSLGVYTIYLFFLNFLRGNSLRPVIPVFYMIYLDTKT